MTRTRIAICVLLLVLLCIIAYLAIERIAVGVRLAFAEEQCQIFAEMSDKAVEALDSQQPDTSEAIEYLECVHNYYPSGTKQIAGSRLDGIVENTRQAHEQRIIEALRETTDSDLGNDAEAWIEHFSKKPFGNTAPLQGRIDLHVFTPSPTILETPVPDSTARQ